MFRLELLPACEGDCLVLSWARDNTIHRILIDAGRKGTARDVLEYAERNRLTAGAFQLFVITHIDRDHIEGAVSLLRKPAFRALVKEVWFNDRNDLKYSPPRPGFESFGALDGERITNLIAEHKIPSNLAFRPRPVSVQNKTLPKVLFPEGLTLTILSPDQDQLAALAKPWEEALEAAPKGWETMGADEPIDIDFLARSKFKSDAAKPNGSSIAIAAEFAGRHVLLTGDAHVSRLQDSLALYRADNPGFKGFSLVKASHHGCRGNTSLELVRQLNCRQWAVSTNGTQFKHPDREGVARIIAGSPGEPTISFNYETDFTAFWRRPLRGNYRVHPIYGNNGYIAIDIEPLP